VHIARPWPLVVHREHRRRPLNRRLRAAENRPYLEVNIPSIAGLLTMQRSDLHEPGEVMSKDAA